MDRSVKYQFVSLFSVVLIALSVIGCSQQPPEPAPEPRVLNVTVLQIDGSPNTEKFQAKLNEYASEDELLTINTNVKQVASTITNSDLLAALSGVDLVVFPSLLNRQLREQTSAFHPIELSGSMPDHIASAYASPDSGNVWAAAFALDPVVFVQKAGISRAAGYSGALTEWSQFRTLTSIERVRGNQEAFWVFLESQNSLQDAWASYLLAFNYGNMQTNLYDQWVRTVQQAILEDAKAFSHSSEAEVVALPKLSNLKAFLQSTAYFLSARYSELSQLSEDELSRVVITPYPLETGSERITYTYAAAAPLNAANPDDAKALVDKFMSDSTALAATLDCLPSNPSAQNGVLNFEENSRFLIREANPEITHDEIQEIFSNDVQNLGEIISKIFDDFFPGQGNV